MAQCPPLTSNTHLNATSYEVSSVSPPHYEVKLAICPAIILTLSLWCCRVLHSSYVLLPSSHSACDAAECGGVHSYSTAHSGARGSLYYTSEVLALHWSIMMCSLQCGDMLVWLAVMTTAFHSKYWQLAASISLGSHLGCLSLYQVMGWMSRDWCVIGSESYCFLNPNNLSKNSNNTSLFFRALIHSSSHSFFITTVHGTFKQGTDQAFCPLFRGWRSCCYRCTKKEKIAVI